MSLVRTAALLVLAIAAAPVAACNVPVFRYALERWKPAVYPIHVFHRGPLTDADRQRVRQLGGDLNATVTLVDLAGAVPAEANALWQRQGKDARLPWVVVRFPESNAEATPAWTGPLADDEIGGLIDSPARRRLATLLLRGEAAVWVVLTGGDPAADTAARRLLTAELKRLEGTVKISTQEDDGDLRTALPLRVSFPILPVDRRDPAEATFVRLLLRSEEGLEAVPGPIVFPVIGRGRALLALHGAELTAANLERWATFLSGPCSCQVKELNPGVDLPLAVGWEQALEIAAKAAGETAAPSAAPAIPPGMATPAQAPRPADASPWLTPVVIVATVAAVAVLFVLARRAARAG
ncbi:MAG: hypothetical protein U0736_24225 [Gemmataceae bacterium]